MLSPAAWLAIALAQAASAASPAPTATYKCSGLYRSYKCVTTLSFNNCKNSIKVVWEPLKLPGTVVWAKTHRNWCSITWTAEGSIEERKFRPEKCDQLLRYFAAALQGFPEVKWQDANCNLNTSPDAILFETQSWERPDGEDKLRESEGKPPLPPEPEVEPKAILLAEARACVLTNDKARVLRCPVIPQRAQSWLRKTLAALGASLVIQNKLK